MGFLARFTLTITLVAAAVACAWAWQLQVALEASQTQAKSLSSRVADLELLLSDTAVSESNNSRSATRDDKDLA